jgi:hypothetical protein
MQTTLKQMFLAAVLSTLAVPALARNAASGHETSGAIMPAGSQQTAGEAASLEKKETGVDAEEPPVRRDNSRKATAASAHKSSVATAHPKAAAVQRTGTRQHGTAKLKTGQLTSGQSAKIQAKQTTFHGEVHPDREDNASNRAAVEKAKLNPQQDKPSNEIHLKKHNARMF